MSDPSSAELLTRYRAGDELAAAELHARYIGRLTRLAAARLSAKVARRADPDDVVQSAFRSFFIRVRDGRLAVEEQHELWRLLASIALHKLYRQARRNTTERRSVDAEQPLPAFDDAGPAFFARDPSPAEAALVADELERIFSRLDPFGRRVLELRLQGESIKEISKETGRSERTVRRALEEMRSLVGRETRRARVKHAVPSHRRGLPAASAHLRSNPPTADPCPSLESVAPDSTAIQIVRYSDYLLKRLIGSGGVGKVYCATVPADGSNVAIKFLRKSFHSDANAVARFRAEAAIVASLDHHGIVNVHGIGQTPGGLYFMVMDLVAGSDLSHIAGRRHISVAEASDWIAQACDVIEHVHQRGVVHCDLKPSNLLLGTDGRIRVTDFGFARSQRAANIGVAGTAAFMAPEQVSDVWGTVGPGTDIYGLGAVLYWLLTGSPPFQGRRAADVLAKVVSARTVTPPGELRADIPQAVNSICSKCLAKTSSDRYSSAQDLGEMLRAVLGATHRAR